MIKENLGLKENITEDDKANIIESMIDYIIGIDKKSGEPYYIPHAKETAFRISVVLYAMQGLTLEDNDSLYDIIFTDEDVKSLISQFRFDYGNHIFDAVDDIVEFKKQMIIHNNTRLNDKLAEIFDAYKSLEKLQLEIATKQNKVLTQQIAANEYQEKIMENMSPEESAELNKRLLSGELDINKIADIVTKNYINSELHKNKQEELIAKQQDKIADLSKYKAMHDARNVLAGKNENN